MTDRRQEFVGERYDRAGGRGAFRLVSYRTIGNFVAMFDCGLIVAASISSGIGYQFFVLSTLPVVQPYIAVGIVSAIIFVSLAASVGLYHTSALLSWRKQVSRVLFPWFIVLFVLALILFLLKIGSEYSRGSLITFAFLGFGFLITSRLVISTTLNSAIERGLLGGVRAIVIGDRKALSGLSRHEVLRKCGAREVARFELPPTGDNNQPGLAVLDDAIEVARSKNAESVLLALQWGDVSRRDFVCERLQALPIPVLLLPDQSISPLLSRPLRQLGSDFAVEIQRAPLSALELVLKRTLDLVLGGALLVGLAPLLAAVSLLIKLDSRGPVIFRQERKGFNGRVFSIYKFRTMTVLENGNTIRQAGRNDPRVTRFGRILRSTSIDELPQLVNVLQGQMSLVGPRPHAVAHDDGYAKLIANYAYRQHVKPGLTGWAQINGCRGETAQLALMEGRVALDLWYIKNWSLLLDLKIIMLTCFELIRRQDAY